MSNKREKSEALYAELREENYVLPEGKTYRSVFIERAVIEFGMTEKGAATYYVNAKKRYEGGEVPSYYKSKFPKPVPVGEMTTFDSRWSVVKIEDGAVVVCHTCATEEKARQEFAALRPENKETCIVVPGVMVIGERVSHISQEDTTLVAANPDDVQEEE